MWNLVEQRQGELIVYKSKRSKACDIPPKVKQEVYERDNGCCIFCGKQGFPNAHIIPRSHGGLGVPQNIITACLACHSRLDNSSDREIYLEQAKIYLRSKYSGWNEQELVYDKWKDVFNPS